MNQSTLIGGALIFTFLLFLASRNRLATYASVLWGSSPAAPIAPHASADAPAAAVSAATPSTAAATQPATVAPASASVAPKAAAAPSSSPVQQLEAAFGSNVQSYASSLNQAAQLAAPLGLLGF